VKPCQGGRGRIPLKFSHCIPPRNPGPEIWEEGERGTEEKGGVAPLPNNSAQLLWPGLISSQRNKQKKKERKKRKIKPRQFSFKISQKKRRKHLKKIISSSKRESLETHIEGQKEVGGKGFWFCFVFWSYGI
jgi:hypothetical protein